MARAPILALALNPSNARLTYKRAPRFLSSRGEITETLKSQARLELTSCCSVPEAPT